MQHLSRSAATTARAALRAQAQAAQQQRRSLRVLAMGNTIIDTVLTMRKIPVDDKVWIDSKKTFVGGQAANAAQGMARLGLDVSFLTRLGADDDGESALARFRAEGMDTRHCVVVPNAQTMSACVTIGTACMSRCCYMHRDEALFVYDVQPHISSIDFSAFDAVYTDGHQMDLALPVVRAAAERGLPVVADIEVLDDNTRTLFELASEVVAPAKTLMELSGCQDPGTAALTLADRPGKTVIATHGELGSYGAQLGDTRALHVPAHKECNAFDTLGAGDAYHAGYMAALARETKGGDRELQRRMDFATAVAAALCETHGPVVSVEALRRFGVL
eukprot:TRINITY_DN15787_c0_g3_i1.p1 TRINITY_DN15787_c0_g3~~TRINITY_DN15787_c0_g3_i1.p1  ORF type:complete len:364 (-),score=89.22 TRINITY_DN15787_c0_g3_i1:61-1056(-)